MYEGGNEGNTIFVYPSKRNFAKTSHKFKLVRAPTLARLRAELRAELRVIPSLIELTQPRAL